MLPESDEFIIVNSVWHVVHRESVENPDERGAGIVEGTASDGRQYVVVLSDRNLADRLVERMGDPNAMAVEIPTQKDWLSFLVQLEEAGHEYVAIDPEPGRRLRIAAIGRVIQAVRDSLKGQQGA